VTRAAELRTDPHDPAVRHVVGAARRLLTTLQDLRLRDGDRLTCCARGMASAFTAGAHLFVCGDPATAAEAASLAHLFASPGGPGGRGDRRDGGGPGEPAGSLRALARPGDIVIVLRAPRDAPPDSVRRPRDPAQIAAGRGGRTWEIEPPDPVARVRAVAREIGLFVVVVATHCTDTPGGAAGAAGPGSGATASSSEVRTDGIERSAEFLFRVPETGENRGQELRTAVGHLLWELTVVALDDRRPGPGAPPPAAWAPARDAAGGPPGASTDRSGR
jgi:hypothetical protein